MTSCVRFYWDQLDGLLWGGRIGDAGMARIRYHRGIVVETLWFNPHPNKNYEDSTNVVAPGFAPDAVVTDSCRSLAASSCGRCPGSVASAEGRAGGHRGVRGLAVSAMRTRCAAAEPGLADL